MTSAKSFITRLIVNRWNYADLKARIITPVIFVLALMTVVSGYSFYQSERSRLHQDLSQRGQFIAASLSAYATNAMTPDRKAEFENHIKTFIKDKKLLHQVTIYTMQTPYLIVTNGNLREKLLPDTLKHYKLPIYSADGKTEIGMIESALSTQEIDDYLVIRVLQIVLVAVTVVVVSIILLSSLLSYVVIRPLENLTSKIQAISMGRLNDKVISMSWDEIGHLFRDINALRIRFKKKESSFIESLVNRKKFNIGSTPATSRKALVVDDDKTILMIASKLLANNQIDVTTASNGKEALAILDQQAFDIILLDLMMPEMTGFDVLNAFKDNPCYNNTPIIVVSSLADKESIVVALNNGATDFILKPFNHDELIARINIHMNKYLNEKELDEIIGNEMNSLNG